MENLEIPPLILWPALNRRAGAQSQLGAIFWAPLILVIYPEKKEKKKFAPAEEEAADTEGGLAIGNVRGEDVTLITPPVKKFIFVAGASEKKCVSGKWAFREWILPLVVRAPTCVKRVIPATPDVDGGRHAIPA